MSDEFSIDIDKALENAKKTDLNGFVKDEYPDGLESVKRSVSNCIDLAGLDKKLMGDIESGEWSEYYTQNSVGRHSKKIVIEYDITHKVDKG
tara:strand:- start:5550 stop:5825 length:276 start_codon:yes stop_codon:yes gene_type:complete